MGARSRTITERMWNSRAIMYRRRTLWRTTQLHGIDYIALALTLKKKKKWRKKTMTTTVKKKRARSQWKEIETASAVCVCVCADFIFSLVFFSCSSSSSSLLFAIVVGLQSFFLFIFLRLSHSMCRWSKNNDRVKWNNENHWKMSETRVMCTNFLQRIEWITREARNIYEQQHS